MTETKRWVVTLEDRSLAADILREVVNMQDHYHQQMLDILHSEYAQ